MCKIALFLIIICFENLMQQQYDFTMSDLVSKWRSKTELYNLLTCEEQLYLSPTKDCNQKFLRRIMKGEKLYVNWIDVEMIKVPQYNVFKVSDILKFAATKTNINQYLPEYDYKKESIESLYATSLTHLYLMSSWDL